MSALAQQLLERAAFLTYECARKETFTPEDFTDEQRMIAETLRASSSITK